MMRPTFMLLAARTNQIAGLAFLGQNLRIPLVLHQDVTGQGQCPLVYPVNSC